MSITENLKRIGTQLAPYQATLVAVSKTKPEADIMAAYHAGHRDFGENKVQELTNKHEQLPADIRWHMIGHLQRNKVKYIAPFVHLIHGVDSERLLQEVNKQGQKCGRTIDCLLQIHIATEASKFGFAHHEALALVQTGMAALPHVHIRGLMGMATNTDNEAAVRQEFQGLKALFDEVKQTVQQPNVSMEVLSMGMSGDYTLALAEGSTMVRIGSAIFGARNYTQAQ